MYSLANYVQFISSSKAVLATSGLDLHKERGRQILHAIKTVTIINLPNTNTLTVRASGGKFAKSFIFQYTTDAEMKEDSWVSVTHASRKYSFTKLTRLREYTIRVIAIGSRGQKVLSDPITRIVQ